jgi:hypothetical protein
VARTRTTKKLAQRIDLNYFKRPTAFKRAKVGLTILLPLLALAWIAWHGLRRDSRVYSSGRMSDAHAVLEQQCAACHVKKAGEFSSDAGNGACLACHDGPIHHENQIAAAVPKCATCHMEHRGRVQLMATSNESCSECHGNLRTAGGAPNYVRHIESLEDGHPEFAALRAGAKNARTIRLNHAIHMQPIRRGPTGPIVQLECQDCHRNYSAGWKYELTADPEMPSYRTASEGPEASWTSRSFAPPSGRERMRAVEFTTACSGCHLLTFDKRFDEGVPHDTPEVVHTFVMKKFQQYIAAHPQELRVVRDPERDLTGKTLQPEARVVTPTEWVGEQAANAETLLWRKTCKQCHSITAGSGALPKIAQAQVTERWLPHAEFDHDAHRGFSCVSCHVKALTSTETTDILVPGITTCQKCHAPGPEHAESRCFECHTYHDWSQRKEVKATFTLPGLGKAL